MFHIFGDTQSNDEAFCLLEYNAVLSTESQPTFWRNMLPPSSESKNKPSKQSSACYLLHAGFLLDLLFDPEDGGDMFLQNVG
jgi:hypothetical protein